MFNVRKSLFETNSSSTHSISLTPIKPKQEDIPCNAELTIFPYDVPSANGHEDYAEYYIYRTQMGKLRYMMHVIVSILYNDVPTKYLTEFKDQFEDWHYRATMQDKEAYAEVFYALPQFKWLCELIKEKVNTNLHIDPHLEDSFPFWETVYDDCDDLLQIFGFNEDTFNDEKHFKHIVSDIIFNEDVVIRDEDIPYCIPDDTNIYEF